MRAQVDSRAREAARIAGHQYGSIATAQLRGVGYSASAVDRLVAKAWLHREFRGVFRWGHRAPSAEARYFAAALACGEGAQVAGMAALYVFDLLRRPPRPEVRAPGAHRHRGLMLVRGVAPGTTWRGIPVTTLPQVLVDVAPRFAIDELARIAHEAEVKHRLGGPEVLELAAGRPGARKLRAIFEGDHQLVLSKLERRFRALLRTHGLPRAITNRKRGAHYVDCRWPIHRLTVELDSFRFHHSRHAWNQDRRRERAARARGDEFRRYTWEDVVEEPAQMLSELRALLGGC